MQKLGLNEIREKFLSFFESKQHLRMKSFSLVPQNDKSLLIINSGMAPLKPYFTGQEIPPRKRVTTCQKCIRTGDIENVGKTARHGTFFEMLGNFSFGDYFKQEIIPWSWEFVTQVMNIPSERVYVSVYEEDDEAYDIWHNTMGLPAEKIFRMGKDDNFWEVGLGPCGPCSELYFDRGIEYGCGKPTCTVGCDCDRFMEFWNLVFTQFNKEEDGSYKKLAHPNIDTGMGLERMAAMMQNVSSIFDVDTIVAIRDGVCRLAGCQYGQSPKKDVSIRIITDHIRSVTFMTADGILPSNEGRGYVLRRLLRRAARHGKLLGIHTTFLTELSKIVVSVSQKAYPELLEKQDYIFKLISVEEDRFYETLDAGMELLKNTIADIKSNLQTELQGAAAFRLYDTYGFPLELMQEILEEEGLTLNQAVFQEQMEKQREKARSAREESTFMGADDTIYNQLDKNLTTDFLGYTQQSVEDATIVCLVHNNELVETAQASCPVCVVTDKTPIYAQSGGQCSDCGTIITKTGTIVVEDCIKVSGNKFAHIGVVKDGFVSNNQKAAITYDKKNRLDIARNHSATHLLQKALREVLGTHVMQAGSFVSSKRLRFDFTHFAAMTSEELKKVEQLVNEKILEGLPITTKEMSIDDARTTGAMALFGEKYGETVRVVDMDGYSVELCGGTHLNNTANIGSFKLLSESGVAAGVRRIEGVTGHGALAYYEENEEKLRAVARFIKSGPENMMKKLETFVSTTKELQSEIEKLRAKSAGNLVDDLLSQKQMINGKNVVIAQVSEMDASGVRTLGDQLKDKLQSGLLLLVATKDDKTSLLAMATDDVVQAGFHCGNIIKQIALAANGSGGGRPNMAQAGLKGSSQTKLILKTAYDVIQECKMNG